MIDLWDFTGETISLKTTDGEAGSCLLSDVLCDRNAAPDTPVALVVENSVGWRQVVPWHAVVSIRLLQEEDRP